MIIKFRFWKNFKNIFFAEKMNHTKLICRKTKTFKRMTFLNEDKKM